MESADCCRECTTPFPPIAHRYRIIRHEHLQTERFCSLICVEAHLHKHHPDWVIISEFYTAKNRPKKDTIHNLLLQHRAALRLYSDTAT